MSIYYHNQIPFTLISQVYFTVNVTAYDTRRLIEGICTTIDNTWFRYLRIQIDEADIWAYKINIELRRCTSSDLEVHEHTIEFNHSPSQRTLTYDILRFLNKALQHK